MSKFYAERVVLAHDDGVDASEREAVWLLIEWPDNEDEPSGFTACTLPATMTRRQLVRITSPLPVARSMAQVAAGSSYSVWASPA